MSEKTFIEKVEDKLALSLYNEANEEKEQRVLGPSLSMNEKIIFEAIFEISEKLKEIEAQLSTNK